MVKSGSRLLFYRNERHLAAYLFFCIDIFVTQALQVKMPYAIGAIKFAAE